MLATLPTTSGPSAPEVLLVHAPFPGVLKFRGLPSSLLAAIGPFVARNGTAGLRLLDPGEPSAEFDAELESLLAGGSIRAVCISTSTAAIEEAAKVADTVKRVAPGALVVLGGPHEDDVEEKAAHRLAAVDVSIAGEAEFALCGLLEDLLAGEQEAGEFAPNIERAVLRAEHGRFQVTVRGRETQQVDRGPIPREWLPPRVTLDLFPRFPVFGNRETVPLMVSRGCAYGKCTFCAEGARGGGTLVGDSFEWVEELAGRAPSAALYFQDSIFPRGEAVQRELLPLLKRLGRPWGAQVYLRTLSRGFLQGLAEHGCRYVYTGLESASPEILAAIGKVNVTPELVLERLGWMRDLGLQVGISLMFGSMSLRGELLETEATIAATEELALRIRELGVDVAGFYPNVQTVLPGTALARGLAYSGASLDYYRMPRCERFSALEDGAVGYNFMTLGRGGSAAAERVVARVVQVSQRVGAFGRTLSEEREAVGS